MPVEDLFQLGNENSEIAKLILFDLVGTVFYFQLSSRFAQHYPNLRSDVAKDWQDYFNVNALDTHMERLILIELNILKERLSEFKNIDLKSRQSRYSNASQSESQNQPTNDQTAFRKFCLGAGFVGGFYMGEIAGKAIATKVIAAAATVNPVVAAGFGGLALGCCAVKWGPQAYEKAKRTIPILYDQYISDPLGRSAPRR